MGTTVNYPEIQLDLVGPDGNNLASIAAACMALRRAGVSSSVIAAFRKDAMTSEYSVVLQTAEQWMGMLSV